VSFYTSWGKREVLFWNSTLKLAIALDLTYLKPNQYEVLDREIYQVLGLLNRLIESLRKAGSCRVRNLETLKL
jgi:hypothetical protein